jgi:hypothetical protein
MRTPIRGFLAGIALPLSLALLAAGCSGGQRAAAPPAQAAGAATSEPVHAESFDAAKALAAQRKVPVLVDFYSPT